MNCFEARSEFVNFWQRALHAERRGDFLTHLKSCPRCDRAFRAFALTAPMLYPGEAAGAASDSSAAIDLSVGSRTGAVRTAEILRRASVHRLRPQRNQGSWRAIAGGVSAAAAAVIIAYFSVAAPPQTWDDAISASTSSAAESEFLGQPMPQLPQANGDIVG
jgi:hypothetical protein